MTDGSFEYGALADVLIDEVKELVGCDLVEQDFAGPQRAYPFFTYKITTPYIKDMEQMNSGEMFDLTVSMACCSDNSIKAQDLAMKLFKNLKSDNVRRKLRTDYDIVIADVDSFDNRSVFQSVNYERRIGFDLHLRVVDGFHEDIPTIDKINLDNTN
ncbi:hypothetical protein NE303_02625 [Levilactobacillus brevis]|uniref:phage neck terminator protein n=1 Tax=Levilactobacillus brevis TaxID=1580 RepID=UPI002072AA1C|nr:hypothetical protein [Levilactobacillus brevis]MCM6799373.1 hypothetical protein [Levilactobacillus brevis]MCM6801929.1 hypothetical protein [Levilactobacillus brevis]MCM6804957.1 hypothetical protein [Levilactobacillus brevis]MCM6807415.1 hypothetical protein [Levilactobacillus brevis]MCM6813297.1 hypothetical protein [Levilactobacillus brevis]